MRKGYKRRRGLVALLSAFVLVFILSIPMFAVDSSAVVARNVYVDGIFYMEDDSVLSDYFEYDTYYEVAEGTMDALDNSATVIGSGYTSIWITSTVSVDVSSTFVCTTASDSSNRKAIYYTDDNTYDDAEFSVYQGRHIKFNHVLLNTEDELYKFITECAAATSTLVYSSSEYYGNSIVDVIVGGFNGIITGLGSGVADFFQTLFIAHDGTGNLSTFAIVSLVFIGVAVAFGIARWIIKKVGQ